VKIKRLHRPAIALALSFSFSACGINANDPSELSIHQKILAQTNPNSDQNQNENDFPFCSQLNFDSIRWPDSFSPQDQTQLALGLNITGSFEGSGTWSNLTNNFDGQGLSMGVLNQNLGQGSLQPLIHEMIYSHRSVAETLFNPSHFKSIKSMVDNWKRQRGFSEEFIPLEDLLPIEPVELIENEVINQEEPRTFDYGIAGSPNQSSVSWAKNNLFFGSNFISTWKRELENLANSKEYRNIQVRAASHKHYEVRSVMRKLNLRELRSYLFIFDMIAQNGGIPGRDFRDLIYWKKINPKKSEAQTLSMLLEFRLRHVNDTWKYDVRQRKTTIINGKGRVHGRHRNIEKEFCVNVSEEI
jgi:hypothetical protein